MPLVQDQINDLAGVDSPIEVKVFGPDFATLRTLAEKVGKVVEEVPGAADVNPHVYLGNPDIIVRPDSVETARVGLTEMDVESQLNAALYGQVASTVPEQDRMTRIRVATRIGFATTATIWDCCRSVSRRPLPPPAAQATRRLPGLASSRLANWRRSVPFEVPTSCGAKTSSPLSP